MAVTLDDTIAKRQHTWSSALFSSQTFWVLIAILVACVYLSFASKAFLTPQNVFNITRNFTFTAIIALGMTFVIITGGIDLSVGSVLCLCSMVIATTMHAGAPLYVGVIAALACGLAVGLFNGVLIAYLGFPSFVVTLGILRWTKFGRHVFAIGGNEHAANLTGIPVRPIKVAVFMISSLTAAIAGIVETGWLGAVTTNIGAGMELQVIAAAVIGGASLVGGAGTAIGALVGAALIEIIRNSLGLLGINPFWQGTVIGLAIVVAVAFERVRQLRSRD